MKKLNDKRKNYGIAYFGAAALMEFIILILIMFVTEIPLSKVLTKEFPLLFIMFYPVVVLGAWFPGVRHILNPRLADIVHDPIALSVFIVLLILISPSPGAAAATLFFGIGAMSHFVLGHPADKVLRSLIGTGMVTATAVAVRSAGLLVV